MILWPAAILTPLALALATLGAGRMRVLALALAPLAALPALALAFTAEPGEGLELPWLLLGSGLRLDDTSIVFLAFGAAVWLAAGVYAAAYHRSDPGAHRVTGFLLAAMCGTFLLTLAADAATFYAGFALMTFSAYGAIVHEGSREARWAGKVYIVLAVLGEACLLGGLILAATAAGTLELAAIPAAVADGPWTVATIVLLLAGFGIKDGLLGLHVWLPLAHPVAPTPASAVLSGVMIKAGLLGWLVFLPIGAAAVTWAATLLIVLGIGGAFFAAGVGVLQRRAKTILAYSSVSQMGIMTAIVGVALAAPELRTPAAAAISLYALHHALTKGALFLAVGVDERAASRARVAVLAGIALLAASLAAAPFTAGAVAKQALKDVAALSPEAPAALVDLLTLTGAATALLLGRAVFVLARAPARGERPPAGLWVPWALIAAAALAGAWVAPSLLPFGPLDPAPAGAWTSLWPPIAGLALLAAGTLVGRERIARIEAKVPAGDVLALLLAPARLIVDGGHRTLAVSRDLAVATEGAARALAPRRAAARLPGLDRRLERWQAAGVAFVLVALVVGVSLW